MHARIMFIAPRSRSHSEVKGLEIVLFCLSGLQHRDSWIHFEMLWQKCCSSECGVLRTKAILITQR